VNEVLQEQPIYTEKIALLLKTSYDIITTQQARGMKFLKSTLKLLFWGPLVIDIFVYVNQTLSNFLSVSDTWKILRRKKKIIKYSTRDDYKAKQG